MQILLVAATRPEIAPFCQWLSSQKEDALPHKVEVLITGIGQAAAVCAITEAVHQQTYDLVIQAGIGGVFGNALALGSVVAIASDTFGDLGIEEKGVFHPLHTTGLQKADTMPYVSGWLPNDWLHALPPLPAVKSITINRISDDPKQTQQFITAFDPIVESMEGAAVHYVCRRRGIPFVQYRSISNTVGERDKTKWKMVEAIAALNDYLIALLPQLQPIHPQEPAKVVGAPLTLSFSPCPNDTFIFEALVHGTIDTEGLSFHTRLEDVETLNQEALNGTSDITKLSYAVLPAVLDRYRVLNSGSALGKGVGPLLVQRADEPAAIRENFCVALPGEHTTAHRLFTLAYPQVSNKVFIRYDQIEEAVLRGQTHTGVLIHENRFTYADKGLVLIQDLGDFWEKQSGQPIPLGGIVVSRALPSALQQTIDRLIRRSIDYAFEQYPLLSDYVRLHAQEMSEAVMRQHIDLYVNAYSLSLGDVGRKAIIRLLDDDSGRWTTDYVFVPEPV